MVRIYQFAGCPFCYAVLARCRDLGLEAGRDYELVEASRGTPGRAEVIERGGLSQVPFLVDGDVQMYESRDIIRYLEQKFRSA
ncbi:MAG: glutathione S-transferase N-terminal domain-containing protein [Leptospiraceae bacterium]|nr:glutathione S-transferase N-terminal domain-containing protein [Leptospiraceae bacterium]